MALCSTGPARHLRSGVKTFSPGRARSGHLYSLGISGAHGYYRNRGMPPVVRLGLPMFRVMRPASGDLIDITFSESAAMSASNPPMIARDWAPCPDKIPETECCPVFSSSIFGKQGGRLCHMPRADRIAAQNQRNFIPPGLTARRILKRACHESTVSAMTTSRRHLSGACSGVIEAISLRYK